jgi:bile acid:Na+ symporter, BASS family
MKLVLMSAIILQVAAIGSQVSPSAVWALVRRPFWIARIGLAMFVLTPLLAVVLAALAKAFGGAPQSMKAAMLLLAISAAAPLLPNKLVKLGIDPAHDTALTVVSAVLAILLVPFELQVLGSWFGGDATVSAAAVARVLAITFVLPLAAGMVLNHFLEQAAERLAPLAVTLSTIIIGVFVLIIIVAQRGTLFSLLREAGLLVLLFAAGSLLIGYLCGGADPVDQTSLAIATVTRHPGLALLMATSNLTSIPDAPSAIIAFILGTGLTAIPFTVWRKRRLGVQSSSPAIAG